MLINVLYYWTFHSVVGFIICCHNIQYNVADVVKCDHMLQTQPNEVGHYIIQHTKHIKWHVRTCTKLGYRVPSTKLNMP